MRAQVIFFSFEPPFGTGFCRANGDTSPYFRTAGRESTKPTHSEASPSTRHTVHPCPFPQHNLSEAVRPETPLGTVLSLVDSHLVPADVHHRRSGSLGKVRKKAFELANRGLNRTLCVGRPHVKVGGLFDEFTVSHPHESAHGFCHLQAFFRQLPSPRCAERLSCAMPYHRQGESQPTLVHAHRTICVRGRSGRVVPGMRGVSHG